MTSDATNQWFLDQTHIDSLRALCSPQNLALAALSGAIACVLSARFIRPLSPLLDYGKTRKPNNRRAGWIYNITVPKQWFVHFYILSLAVNTWIWATRAPPARLALLMLMAQALRRLAECLVETPSGAKMHLAHYLVGLVFYVCETVSVMTPSSPSAVWTIAALVLFSACSVVQWSAHSHLRSLVKYTLPHSRVFRTVVCPHYAAEMGIYASLAMANPNRVSVLSFVWVAVNLGVSAEQTWLFYRTRFAGCPRYAVIPGVF